MNQFFNDLPVRKKPAGQAPIATQKSSSELYSRYSDAGATDVAQPPLSGAPGSAQSGAPVSGGVASAAAPNIARNPAAPAYSASPANGGTPGGVQPPAPSAQLNPNSRFAPPPPSGEGVASATQFSRAPGQAPPPNVAPSLSPAAQFGTASAVPSAAAPVSVPPSSNASPAPATPPAGVLPPQETLFTAVPPTPSTAPAPQHNTVTQGEALADASVGSGGQGGGPMGPITGPNPHPTATAVGVQNYPAPPNANIAFAPAQQPATTPYTPAANVDDAIIVPDDEGAPFDATDAMFQTEGVDNAVFAPETAPQASDVAYIPLHAGRSVSKQRLTFLLKALLLCVAAGVICVGLFAANLIPRTSWYDEFAKLTQFLPYG